MTKICQPGTLERAIVIATEAHAGQTDKAGQPYILHPLRVMTSLGVNAGQPLRIVAVLHDVLEDCEAWTPNLLRAEGFDPRIVEAVEAITKRKHVETYGEYIQRVRANPLARLVKIADIEDNLHPDRAWRLNPDQCWKYGLAIGELRRPNL
ncbi:HD domain-containing protein [Ancylobacter rudongensis]|uniref:HD domain-containing protein n=1 Tax=Ancylobacter rudongensis TaxID=177413 RepID=A0A1G4UNY4_9HYPH|nr:HD domain-containing protein [Ancylobacter rudongensis]SCW95376.1 HD domain-containing protein [Ancylobacter rudongensis]